MTDFEALYRRYAADVFRFALYLTGDRSEAEDITSEAFIRAWISVEIIESTAKAYLLRIARNAYLDRVRRCKPEVELDETVADSASEPLQSLELQAKLNSVLRALQDVPETERMALLLHAQQELTYDEIARAMGISLPAVKAKIYRARLKLARLLSAEEVRK